MTAEDCTPSSLRPGCCAGVTRVCLIVSRCGRPARAFRGFGLSPEPASGTCACHSVDCAPSSPASAAGLGLNFDDSAGARVSARAAERETEGDREHECNQERDNQLLCAAFFGNGRRSARGRGARGGFARERCLLACIGISGRWGARGLATGAFRSSFSRGRAFGSRLGDLRLCAFAGDDLTRAALGERLLLGRALLTGALGFRLALRFTLLLVGRLLLRLMCATPTLGVAAILLADAQGRTRSSDGGSHGACRAWSRGTRSRRVRTRLPRARGARCWACRFGRVVPI